MLKTLLSFFTLTLSLTANAQQQRDESWQLVWHDEFDGTGVVDLHTTINGKIGNGSNPFHQPQYILLNLAIGGQNGGHIQPDAFPMRYEIDYVRVYQKK